MVAMSHAMSHGQACMLDYSSGLQKFWALGPPPALNQQTAFFGPKVMKLYNESLLRSSLSGGGGGVGLCDEEQGSSSTGLP